MPFVDFKIEMAEGLLNSRVSGTPRGRPSTTRVEAIAGARVGARAGAKEEKRKPRPNHEYASAESVRYDNVSHWPMFTKDRKQCKLCITLKTSAMCEKCKVHQCLVPQGK